MAEVEKIADILDKKIAKTAKRPKPFKYEIEEAKQLVDKNGTLHAGGMPRGHVTKRKLEQLTVAKAVNQRIMAHADELLNAALSLAKGQQVLMCIVTEGTGKNRKRYHEMVTDPELIKQYLDWEEGIGDAESPDDDNHYYYITTKSPDMRAIQYLFDRALGKTPDKLEVVGGFFTQNELTIKVVGSQHDVINLGDESVSSPAEPRADAERTPGPGDQDPQSPASS